MVLRREGALLLLGVTTLAVIIALIVLPEAVEGEPIRVLVRLFALYGFLFLNVAVLTTPFLKEIRQALGRSFLKVHHSFAMLGIIFITLHPFSASIQSLSLSVFVPRFDSWEIFWTWAGRPAFIMIYIALLAAFLRRSISKYWRAFHALMYVVLLFGIVHANLIGGDFQNPIITVIYNALFVASIAGFVVKRYRNYRFKKNSMRSG